MTDNTSALGSVSAGGVGTAVSLVAVALLEQPDLAETATIIVSPVVTAAVAYWWPRIAVRTELYISRRRLRNLILQRLQTTSDPETRAGLQRMLDELNQAEIEHEWRKFNALVNRANGLAAEGDDRPPHDERIENDVQIEVTRAAAAQR